MLRMTLDTGCVIAAVMDEPDRAEYVNELVSQARAGEVELWLATGYDLDQGQPDKPERSANLRWLAQRPISRGLPAPFRLNKSMLGRGDDVGYDDDPALVEQLEDIVYPGRMRVLDEVEPSELRAQLKRRNDIHHLAAHVKAGHDAFVSLDEAHVLSRWEPLDRLCAIIAVHPACAVAIVREGSPSQALEHAHPCRCWSR